MYPVISGEIYVRTPPLQLIINEARNEQLVYRQVELLKRHKYLFWFM